MTTRCLGILREAQNSPNRESDDLLILTETLGILQSWGWRTLRVSPEQFDSLDRGDWDLALPMCESYPRLMGLKSRWSGALLVNDPQAVLNCYRRLMVPLLSRENAVGFPPSEARPVESGPGEPPPFQAPEGWWIKRGDVHNTCDRDVVRIARWSALRGVLQDFESREITHYVVQPHVPGDLVKFYGVGPQRWFAWFYHDPGTASRIPFQEAALSRAAGAAASALGLEVFGGDAIIGPGGSVTLIDINSWPSFARVRREASLQIAFHLWARALRTARPPPGSGPRALGASPKPL